MARPTFIELYNTLEDAILSQALSESINLYDFNGIKLLPNSEYSYIQTTQKPDGIELEDWEVFIVDGCGSKTDITSFFTVEEVFNDEDGLPQITWSLNTVPFDFGNKLVYLEVNQLVGETFYSNYFKLTDYGKEKTARIDYGDSKSTKLQSIQFEMYFWQNLKIQDLSVYYETSTKNTVTNLIKSQKHERWKTPSISNESWIKLTDAFECKYVYVDLFRSYPFEALEVKEFEGEENYKENIFKLSFNKKDIYDPNAQEEPIELTPTITLSSVTVNGNVANYTFTYENFTTNYLVYEYSDDLITWTQNTNSTTSPKSIPFTETGTWYFRISHPLAISNIIQLDLGEQLLAVDDSRSVTNGQTITISVLSNDTIVGVTTITAVGTPLNGTATIVNSGTQIEYTHDGSNTTNDSFTYTISNGNTSDSATVSMTIVPDTNYSSVLINSEGDTDPSISCGMSYDTQLYYTGVLDVGIYLYTDINLTTPFVGGNKYFKMSPTFTAKITAGGLLIDIQNC